ncbi:MAG: SGNH/GDSL hydrolase family protein [Candidatus Levyibacteriota bacterium]
MLMKIWGHVSYFLKDFGPYLIILFTASIFFLFSIIKIYKSKISQNKKNALLLLVFTLVSFIFIYSGFEAYLRFRFDESDSLGFLKVSERWFQRHVVFNNFNYRDKKFTLDKTPGVVRIGVIGDSLAMGYGIKNINDRFSNILEKKLNDNGSHVEIYNFAQSGFDTEHETLEYQKVKKFNFDILLWSYFLNDIEEASKSAGTAVLKKAQELPSPLIQFLSDNSFLFNYIYWRLDARYDKTFSNLKNADLSQYDDQAVFSHHKQLISSFSAQLQAENKKTVVVIFPFFYFFPNYPLDAIAVHNRMDKIFQDNGALAIVDMLNYVKGKNKNELVVGPYDAHPNEYVHNLTAEKLYDAIFPLLENKDGQTFIK